uniref:Uncharacterized protein n=1 Tax=Kalanchoe fedtschenkoi TaxID=63787 RepID=A0A7N0UVM5_KALFE
MECKYEQTHHRKIIECEDLSEDDFYAEIRRQILLLTADDDEEHVIVPTKMKTRSACGSTTDSFMTQQRGRNHHHHHHHQVGWWEEGNDQTACSAPVWLRNLWRGHASVSRSSGGTGVFIPHIVKSGRKHKAGSRRGGALAIGLV